MLARAKGFTSFHAEREMKSRDSYESLRYEGCRSRKLSSATHLRVPERYDNTERESLSGSVPESPSPGHYRTVVPLTMYSHLCSVHTITILVLRIEMFHCSEVVKLIKQTTLSSSCVSRYILTFMRAPVIWYHLDIVGSGYGLHTFPLLFSSLLFERPRGP